MNVSNKTKEYLKKAISGETNASRLYGKFSEIAQDEGYINVALLFRSLEQAETIHINNHKNALAEDYSPEILPFEPGNTLNNLIESRKTENYEHKRMYPGFIKAIRPETKTQYGRVAALSMEWALKVEKTHSRLLRRAIKRVKKGEDLNIQNIYVCRVCGNIIIGSEEPESACPVCGHDAFFYTSIKNDITKKSSNMYIDKFHLQGGEIVRQVTFGMNDGVVSIFALLAGVAGAGQNPQTILITLFAATVAGALSMAAGEFISGKSESDYYNHEINQERLEIKLVPEIEKEELSSIYRGKGLTGAFLENVVEQITKEPDRWAREMVIDELGVTELEHKSGLKNAVVIFFAFITGACFPVLPYLFLFNTSLASVKIFYIATIVTVAGLFMAGALKKFVTGVNWFKSGMEMLIVGLFAYGVSYIIGSFIPF